MLSVADSLMWDALEIGPQWILRETEDVTLSEVSLRAGLRKPASLEAGAQQKAPRAAAPGLPPGLPPEFSARSAPSRPVPAARSGGERIAPSIAAAPQAPKLALSPEVLAACEKADWATLEGLAQACTCCSMAKSRQHVVFAEGGPGMRIALVGEAPGSEEDLQGIPFVGKSGQLLTQMLESIGIERRRDIAIMNVLKCRPPGNRNPAPAEVSCCAAYLRRQLLLVRPDVLLIMGRFAMQTLLGTGPDATIGSQRGRVHDVSIGDFVTKAVVSYHPSYLLRSPDEKAKAWEDLVLFRRLIREAGIELAPTAARDKKTAGAFQTGAQTPKQPSSSSWAKAGGIRL